MKKRILYIILGVMLLSVKGIGQITFNTSINTVCAGDNSYVLTFNNNTSSTIYFYTEISNAGQNNWSPSQIFVLNPFNPYIFSPFIFISKDFRVTYSTAIDGSGNLISPSTTTIINITVNPLPTITTTGTLSALCYSSNVQSVTQTATLSYTATTYTPTSYSIDWDAPAITAGLLNQSITSASFLSNGGDLSTINIQSSVITGTYNGSLKIANANGCSSTKAISILIKPLPVVIFRVAAALNECQNNEITYTTQEGKTNYQWMVPGIPSTDYIITKGGKDFNDSTLTLKWLKTGSKTIQVNYTDANSCTAENNKIATNTTTVNALPIVAAITGSGNVCVGSAVTLSNSTTGGIWSSTSATFAGINSSGLVTGLSSGTSTITYTLTDLNLCSTTVNKGLTVNPLPTKPTLTSQEICDGTTATITGPSGTYTYTWQVPTGVATSTTKSVSTSKAGTYTLTIMDANSCTSEAGTATVTVNPLPVKPTLTSQAICEGLTATITGPSGTYTYTWQVPTGVATSTTKSVSTSKAGTYTLTITDANSCTSEAGTATVTVNQLPAKPTLTSQAICEGETTSVTMLTPTGTITYTYTWIVPTGVATSTTKTVSTTKAGTYSLTITDANSCTSEVGTGIVTVNTLPAKPTLTSPKICEGETASVTMLTPTGTITYTYTWTVPTGVATSTTKTVSTSKAGTYSLTITDANSCVSEVGTGSVTINPIPTFNILSPSVCSGSQLKITANPLTGASTDYNYTWQVPTGVSNPANVSNFMTTTAGVYTATIKNKITNCESAPLSNTVIFYPLPVAAPIIASANKVIMNKTLNLTAAASGGTSPYIFTWTPNSNYSISGQENAVFNAIKEGKVKIQYQVKDAKNCTVNSADYEITIESEDIILILPNAFTPNGDGNNDIFKIASSNLLGQASFKSFEIYNRNGKLLYRTEKIEAGWDGRSGDFIQDMGIYFVKLVKLDKDGKQVVDTTPFYLLK